MIPRDEKGYLIMPKDMLHNCAELFMRVGVRSVSMDDVSRHLGISKKTLYQYVSNKGELIAKIIRLKVEKLELELHELFTAAPDALDAFIKYSFYILKNYGWMNPKVVYDLKKYYPTGWKIYEDHLDVFTFSLIKNNLSRGIEEGLFRPSMKPDVITSVYLRLILELFDSSQFPLDDYSQTQIMEQFLEYHLHGISIGDVKTKIEEACKVMKE